VVISKDISDIVKVCADCGNCLYACPVYNAEFTEPNSPRGKVNIIKGIIDGELSNTSLSRKFIYQCVLCGSCEDVCTKGVDYVDMMVNYRTVISKGKKIPLLKKIVLSFYQSFLYKKLLFFIDIISKTYLKKLFLIPRRRKLDLKKYYTSNKKKTYDILFFPGCVLTDFYPEIVEKTINFLRKNGFTVLLPKGLSCCGFPYISQGWKDKFDKYKGKNMKVLNGYNFKSIVIPCGTGTITFKKYYDIDKDISVYELTDFIYKFINDAKLDNALIKDRKITYHDPCHNIKSLHIEKQPRHFLSQAGKNFIDDKSKLCCGFGGVFSIGFPSTSNKILKRKSDTIKQTGADTVITSCPGCYMQLRENLSLDVKFFTDIF